MTVDLKILRGHLATDADRAYRTPEQRKDAADTAQLQRDNTQINGNASGWHGRRQ